MKTGAPEDYRLDADIAYPIESKPVHKVIKVNDPATYGSTKIYLQANGYSPMVVIKDGKGKTTFEGAVPFLPQDGNLTSTGAIKLPDMNPQIGIVATFTPTYSMSGKRGAFSSYPEVLDPRLVFSIWQGNLGLDTGIPQSVYRVDTSKMTRIGLKSLKVGESYNFNSGSITFAGWKPWVNIEVGRDPGKDFALIGAILAILGLLISLSLKERDLYNSEINESN